MSSMAGGFDEPWSGPVPEFERPPLSEVGCALQFAHPLPLNVVDLARLRDAYADRYPETEQHPAAPPIQRSGQPEFQFTLGQGFQLPRLWFLDASSTQLVQLQADRLGWNWRKVRDTDEYCRYEATTRSAVVDAFER